MPALWSGGEKVILSADWHLRRNPPRSRTDDYFSAQERKLRFILKLAQESPPLLVAGDFFDQAKPGPFIERWIIELLKEYIYPKDRIQYEKWGERSLQIYVVPGQHDLPGHNIEQINDSGLGVLASAGVITLLSDPGKFGLGATGSYGFNGIINGWPWGHEYELIYGNPNIAMDGGTVLLWHHMVINSEPLWPGQVADKAIGLLKKYKDIQIIVTGDNHQTFAVASPDGRWLVNPGSVMRMTAAQAQHRPCVFKWESGKLEQIFLPISQDVLDLTDLERAKEKDSRISAFVESLDKQYEIGLSYEKNLEEHMQINETNPEVQKIVWGCLENGK